MSELFPNFLIIGAARSGTSSLYEYMRQHPDIFFSELKEPMFFSFQGQVVDFSGPGDNKEINSKAINETAAYNALFAKAAGKQAIGEASANYLYSERAAKNIKKTIPDVKLIAILRNPVERAYSSYLYTVRDGREKSACFEDALKQETARIDNNWEHIWHYKNMGFYGAQLTRYYELFPPEQIKVILQEDLKNNTVQILREVFEFLGVDSGFRPDMSVEYNQGGKPKSQLLNKLLTRPSKIKRMIRPLLPRFILDGYINLKHKNLDRPVLGKSTRDALIEDYRGDIELLETLLSRDLSCWLAE